jgi:hypothetical protein
MKIFLIVLILVSIVFALEYTENAYTATDCSDSGPDATTYDSAVCKNSRTYTYKNDKEVTLKIYVNSDCTGSSTTYEFENGKCKAASIQSGKNGVTITWSNSSSTLVLNASFIFIAILSLLFL